MTSLSRIFFFWKTWKNKCYDRFFLYFLLIYYDRRFIKYIKNYIFFIYIFLHEYNPSLSIINLEFEPIWLKKNRKTIE